MTQQARQIVVEHTAEQADEFAAQIIRATICDVVGARSLCHVALAGGTTPRSLYQKLAQGATAEAVPWGEVEFFFSDERDVPHDHVESNYNMVQRVLLDQLPIEPSRIHPMPADAEDLATAAAEYEQDVRRIVPAGPDGLPQLDLILLGMGGDGHVASLFPDTEALNETTKLVTTQFVPVLGRRRMTLTFPLINAARLVLLLVTGDDKSQTVAAMLGDDQAAKSKLPAARLDPKHGKLIVVLDAQAARYAHQA